MLIHNVVEKQRAFFQEDITRNKSFRLQNLQRLKEGILQNEDKIKKVLKQDLNKSEYESFTMEMGVVLKEINFALKSLKRWMKPKIVKNPLTHFGAKSKIYPQPYGVVLIISPWNYPFQLSILPLIGAISAGNTVILKPSEYTPHFSKWLHQFISNTFPPEYIAVIEGDSETSQQLLQQKFDYIFFTGSVDVGKIVMRAASENLTPVTLELGGKSPVIVDDDANLDLAARRIVWGKYTNAGQTCIAPDYLLVHEKVADDLLVKMKKEINHLYGDTPLENPHFTKIISNKHFKRLKQFLNDGDVFEGGQINEEAMTISPTILKNVSWDAPIMQEEIFGPILPVFPFHHLSEGIEMVKKYPHPLALYFFSNHKDKKEYVIRNLSYGGGCINDTLMHCASPYLPFGGIGNSGMGSYHGTYSFKTFSHYKSIVFQTNLFDFSFRYPHSSYGLKILRRIMK